MSKNRKKRTIVNVASVPQRSVFRYPGGKTWLVPYIRTWIRSLPYRPRLFAEPFVGGGSISLTVGIENLASLVTMVELDQDVAAVWHTLLSKDVKWLCNKIMTFDLTVENVKAELAKKGRTTRQRAFNTILKNRTFHGGIMAHGSGILKYGEAGKGIMSRWYPSTLCNRIFNISCYSSKFRFYEGDGLEFIERNSSTPETVFFIDPPYTAGGSGKRAGRRLYNHSELDHNRLFDLVSTIKGDFLMTYDDDTEVRMMAKRRCFDVEAVPMKNTHHAEMNELLIGKNLDWVRDKLYPTSLPILFD